MPRRCRLVLVDLGLEGFPQRRAGLAPGPLLSRAADTVLTLPVPQSRALGPALLPMWDPVPAGPPHHRASLRPLGACDALALSIPHCLGQSIGPVRPPLPGSEHRNIPRRVPVLCVLTGTGGPRRWSAGSFKLSRLSGL